MTVAVMLKVHEGVVLAADSASTLIQRTPDGAMGVVNVYNNANKIVNLIKGLPLGVITWGAGSIGSESITTIYKDLRQMLTGEHSGPDGADWQVKPGECSVAAVTDRVREYVYDVKYSQMYSGVLDAPELGMIVTGYSTDGAHAESYQVTMNGAGCPAPQVLMPDQQCGMTVGGQQEAIARLVFGVDPRLPAVLTGTLSVPPQDATTATRIIQQQFQAQVIQDAMPFQDALDLGEFLVDLTVRYTRFIPGAGTVGGPIELAGITKHEGFKWIKRKHYYQSALNQ